jgi:hypothetical protein
VTHNLIPASGVAQPFEKAAAEERVDAYPVVPNSGKFFRPTKRFLPFGVWRRVYIKDDHCFSQVVGSRGSFFVLC